MEVGLLPIVNISVRLPDLSKHLNAQCKSILGKKSIRDHLGWWSLVEHYTLHNIHIYKWAFELSSNVSDLSLFSGKFQQPGGEVVRFVIILCVFVS